MLAMVTMIDGRTILELFLNRVSASGSETAIRFKRTDAFETKTWQEIGEDVRRVAAGLKTLSIEPGDRVAQLSENRYEWIVADLAIQMAEAIHVPIHAPLAASQVDFQVNHSGSKALFVSGSEQIAKVAEADLPQDLNVITYESTDAALPQQQLHISSWLDQEAPEPGSLEQAALENTDTNDLATILYTSGTTGEPKGVMLTQKNLVSNTLAVIQTFGMEPGDKRLTFLPLSHIFARTCDLYTWIGCGCELALAQSRETVLQDCAEIHPTVLNGVPYFYDLLLRGLQQHGLAETPGALNQMLGGKIRYCCTGGAALPDHLFDFFKTQEVPLLQGYGLTETSPVISMSTPKQLRRGASGQAIPDVEVAISEEGEIISRGPHIMRGYWRNEEATSEVIIDDWFHTGDLGKVDEDGFVWITGRKKELIVTAAGKNIAPVLLESLLTQDPLIEQALVIGDGRNYLTALIVPNVEQVTAQLSETSNLEKLLEQPEVQTLFEKCVEERLMGVSHHEQVRRFCLIDRPFSIEAGEMTAKLSLRRPIIESNFSEQIESMYRKTREE